MMKLYQQYSLQMHDGKEWLPVCPGQRQTINRSTPHESKRKGNYPYFYLESLFLFLVCFGEREEREERQSI